MALCLPRKRSATSLATRPSTLSVASITSHSCFTSAGLALKVFMRVDEKKKNGCMTDWPDTFGTAWIDLQLKGLSTPGRWPATSQMPGCCAGVFMHEVRFWWAPTPVKAGALTGSFGAARSPRRLRESPRVYRFCGRRPARILPGLARETGERSPAEACTIGFLLIRRSHGPPR